jgi:hypothetical protein
VILPELARATKAYGESMHTIPAMMIRATAVDVSLLPDRNFPFIQAALASPRRAMAIAAPSALRLWPCGIAALIHDRNNRPDPIVASQLIILNHFSVR